MLTVVLFGKARSMLIIPSPMKLPGGTGSFMVEQSMLHTQLWNRRRWESYLCSVQGLLGHGKLAGASSQQPRSGISVE